MVKRGKVRVMKGREGRGRVIKGREVRGGEW